MKTNFIYQRALLASLVAAFIHAPVVAEDQLPNISVTASPLVAGQNLNTTTMTLDEIKTMAAATSDTASILRNTPGLNLQQSGGVASLPVIHGLADDRLRIKVDGMDIISACGNHMNPALSYIDPSNVSSASVFTVLSPVSSGGDSIGGTILVESPAPQFSESSEELLTTGEVGAFYRSNGNVQGGNVSATVAGDTVSITYQGSTVKSDNYDAADSFKPAGYSDADFDANWLDSDEVGSTQYESSNQSIAFAVRHENHLIQFKYGEQDIPYQGWVNQRMDMTDNESEQYNLSYEGQFDWGNLEARAYKERTRHVMQFDDDKLYWYARPTTNDGIPCVPAGMVCAAGMPMDTKGKNEGFSVKAEFSTSERDLFRVGTELQNYTLNDWWDPSGMGMWPDTFWNINNGQRDRIAVFGEWEATWDSQWSTLFGVRAEQVDMDTDEVQGYNATYDADANAFNASDRSITDHNIDITALARYTVNNTSDIEFGYAQKTRSPNLYERYTWSTGGMAMRMINWAGDGNGYVGNVNLDPEISHTISATLDMHDAARRNWGFKVTPYYTYVDDYIDAKRLPGQETATETYVYLRFVNQSAKLYGIDLSGNLTLAEHTPYGSFTATGIINYVRGTNEDTNDDLYNMMPLNGRFSIHQNLKNWTNTIEWELVDKKDNVSWERNEMKTAGYGLLHLRSSYQWKQVRIDVGVENVLDKFYNHPLGGTYMGQGKTMSDNPMMGRVEWGTPVPGMGRSIYAGVNYKF